MQNMAQIGHVPQAWASLSRLSSVWTTLLVVFIPMQNLTAIEVVVSMLCKFNILQVFGFKMPTRTLLGFPGHMIP